MFKYLPDEEISIFPGDPEIGLYLQIPFYKPKFTCHILIRLQKVLAI